MNRQVSAVYLCLSVVTLCVNFSLALKRPDWFDPCPLDTPDYNKCVKHSMEKSLPHVLHGDPAYHIPNLLPLEITELNFGDDSKMAMKIKNAKVYGLEGTKIEDINIDLEKQHGILQTSLPVMSTVGEYSINGKVMVLPIVGSGNCNFTGVNGRMKYEYDYTIVERKGARYFKLENKTVDYAMEKMYFHLDNLFNGDEALTKNMNDFLNENWREVLKDIDPSIRLLLSTIIDSIFNGILTKIPVDEIFGTS